MAWQKTQESDFWIEYQAPNMRRLLLKRMGFSADRSVWIIQIEDIEITKKASHFNTKSAALAFAKRWMRAHPNG